MPRNVRNFWISADIDGRKSKFVAGPRSRDGGFDLMIYQRCNGTIADNPLTIIGRVNKDGKLVLTIQHSDYLEHKIVTER